MAKRLIGTDTIIDKDTGEILKQEQRYVSKETEPDYVKLYVRAWCAFKQIKGVNTSFLYAILPYMTYADDGQYVCIPAFLKKRIGTSLGWKETTVIKRFTDECAKLAKTGVLKKIAYNTYQVNPELIGKGEWKDIKRLRVTFNLETGEVEHSYQRSPKTVKLRMVN